MEGEANQTQQPTPCRTGCGFYGNQASDGLCSKCYKDAVKQSQDASTAAGRPGSASTTPSTTSTMTQTPTLPNLVTQKDNNDTAPSVSSVSGSVTPEKQAAEDLSAEASASEGATGTADESTEKVKKKNRCHICRKKVGLTGFVCRCSGLFCGLHRYSDKHNCSFDYKADAREQIAKQNPVIVGEKVRKI